MLGTVINIFKIPDLRKKILFTVAMLCIYRIGFAIPVPGIDQAKLAAGNGQTDSSSPLGRVADYLQMFTGGRLDQSSLVRSWYHALHFGVDYSDAAGRSDACTSQTAAGRADGLQEDTGIYAISDGAALRYSGDDVSENDGRICLSGHVRHGDVYGYCRYDGGNDFPDVARRADRRIRHRQRYKPYHHGRYYCQNAMGDRPVLAQYGLVGRRRSRQIWPDADDFPAGVICVCGGRSDSDHSGTAANSDSAGKADARPSYVRRAEALSAAACQSRRRYADHLRVELDDVPAGDIRPVAEGLADFKCGRADI